MQTDEDLLGSIRKDLPDDAALQAAFGANAELDKCKRVLEAQALKAVKRARSL